MEGRFHLIYVVRVVSDDQRYIQLLSQSDQTLIDLGQLRDVLVALNLQEVSVAEPFLIPASRLGRRFIVAVGQKARDLG